MAYFIGKTEDGKDIYGVDFDIEIKGTKQADDGKRTISMRGSTPSVDRDGDTINQSGWDTRAFKKNPVIQWAHDHSIPAIGRANKFVKSKEALDFQEIEFPKGGTHLFADMIYSLLKDKFIKMGSVGFIPIKSEDREIGDDEKERFNSCFFRPQNFIKQELLEFSIVNVGSNRDALVNELGQKGFKSTDANKLFDSMMTQDKRVIPYKKYPLDDEDATWNGPKEVAAAEVSDLKKMSTWVDAENDEIKSGYKLPHHRADGYNTVWKGVAAAMAALLGARGGVDIPDGERKGVFRHLEKHYKEWDKPVPDFKGYSDAELKEMFPDDMVEDFTVNFLDGEIELTDGATEGKCLGCGKDISVDKGEQFAHEGKHPLCEECFNKAKDAGLIVDKEGVFCKECVATCDVGIDNDDAMVCCECGKTSIQGEEFIARGIDPIVYRCQKCDDKHTGKAVARVVYDECVDCGAEFPESDETLCPECVGKVERALDEGEAVDDKKESKFEPISIYKTIDMGIYVECWTDEKGEGGFLLPKDILTELEKAGAVLNRANKKKLKDAIELIGAVLASAEPAAEDGKDATDTKPQPPKEVSLKDVADKLDVLIKDITGLSDTHQASKITEDEIDLEDEAPDEINLEELELPPCPEKDKDEVDLDAIAVDDSQFLEEVSSEIKQSIAATVKNEINRVTGKVD